MERTCVSDADSFTSGMVRIIRIFAQRMANRALLVDGLYMRSNTVLISYIVFSTINGIVIALDPGLKVRLDLYVITTLLVISFYFIMKYSIQLYLDRKEQKRKE